MSFFLISQFFWNDVEHQDLQSAICQMCSYGSSHNSGAEYGYFGADITRTFPVNGRFSPEQRTLYELVLNAQRSAIDAAPSCCSLVPPIRYTIAAAAIEPPEPVSAMQPPSSAAKVASRELTPPINPATSIA